jgi:hypothetical protein
MDWDEWQYARVCCNKEGSGRNATELQLTGQLSGCVNYYEATGRSREDALEAECCTMIRHVIRRLANEHPEALDREAVYFQRIVDSQMHDHKHVPHSRLDRKGRRFVARARRVIKWLVQAGAKQPEPQSYFDGCYVCDPSKLK